MGRYTLRDEGYYQAFLENHETRIEEFEHVLDISTYLYMLYFNKFIALYSAGHGMDKGEIEMVRDSLREAQYFKKYIEFENETIAEFKASLSLVIEQRGVDDEGAKDGFKTLCLLRFNKLNAMYSGGWNLKEIKDFVPEVIEYVEKAWTGHYLQMLWILSIGMMLEIDEPYIEKLEKLVRKYRVEDALLDYLLSSRRSPSQILESPLLHENPYQKLIDLIHLSDKQEQIQIIRTYLENHWYSGHEDTGWYDSHKNKDDIYNGYWSYESGAIVKILGLDDSSLKDVPYYPYDMVHFKEKR